MVAMENDRELQNNGGTSQFVKDISQDAVLCWSILAKVPRRRFGFKGESIKCTAFKDEESAFYHEVFLHLMLVNG